MNLFDQLEGEALRSKADLTTLRPVVEKELLHHDILRELSVAGLLTSLTFIGGTCLRTCYGSPRLSEDLDFTGGSGFKKEDLSALAVVLMERLQTRYGLPVSISEPVKTGGNVSTWKLTIETPPEAAASACATHPLGHLRNPQSCPAPDAAAQPLRNRPRNLGTDPASAEPGGDFGRQNGRPCLPRERHQKP